MSKKTFLNYFMDELKLKPITMQKCTGRSSKTIYNYRQLEDNLLPEEVWHKIFNFFIIEYSTKIEYFDDVTNIISKMSGEEKLRMKFKFEDICETRHAGRISGYSPAGSSTDGMDEFFDYITKYRKRRSRRIKASGFKSIDDVPYSIDIENRQNTINRDATHKTTTIINIPSSTTEGFRKAIQEQINEILKNGNDYNFINYISNYKNQ